MVKRLVIGLKNFVAADLLAALERSGDSFEIFDNTCAGQTHLGRTVYPIDAVADHEGVPIIAIFNWPFIQSIYPRIESRGAMFVEAYVLAHPDVGMDYLDHGDSFFFDASRFNAIRRAMGDERSRQLLDAVRTYRQTGDRFVLQGHTDPIDQLYLDPDLIVPNPSHIFIDGGAYDGDSARQFIAYHGGVARAELFEPGKIGGAIDFKGNKNVSVHRRGLSSASASVGYHEAGLNSHIDDGADADHTHTMIQTTTIDELDVPATFIKLDVEGHELAALAGAERTIRQHRPTLAISAYHKPNDIESIVEHIAALKCNYRIYLRQYDVSPFETVLYFLPQPLEDAS